MTSWLRLQAWNEVLSGPFGFADIAGRDKKFNLKEFVIVFKRVRCLILTHRLALNIFRVSELCEFCVARN